MKLNDLQKAAAKAQQDLQLAERKVTELLRNAKSAKAKSEQARLQYKHVRKVAKQAKKLALAAEEEARERSRVWEKTQKRLAKALKKQAKAKGKATKKPASTAARAGKGRPREPVAKQPPPISPKTQKPAVASQASWVSPGVAAPPPASATV